MAKLIIARFEVRAKGHPDHRQDDPDTFELVRTKDYGPRSSHADVWAMTLSELRDLRRVIGIAIEQADPDDDYRR